VVSPLGDPLPVPASATVAVTHEFAGDDLIVLAEQHALPPVLTATLDVWAQPGDEQTAWAHGVDAHARWRELGWKPG
jgi:hypothetical protein